MESRIDKSYTHVKNKRLSVNRVTSVSQRLLRKLGSRRQFNTLVSSESLITPKIFIFKPLVENM